MEEIRLYDQIFLIEPGNHENSKMRFIDKEIPNYRVYYKGKSLGTIKEMIINTDRKIKMDKMREIKGFYITIIAHLIAQYIIKRIKKRSKRYAEYLKMRNDLLVKSIYTKILNGPVEKYQYLGKVWSYREIMSAFINYMGDKIREL